MRGLHATCQELKYTRGQFHDARDVPNSPEVLLVAQQSSQIVDGAYDRFCTREGRKQLQRVDG